MKLLCVTILLLLHCVSVNAQTINAVKYIWQNETAKTNASVEIYDTDSKKSKGCIYFITNVDTAYTSRQDSLFNQFIASSNSQYAVVKISFYDLYDSSKLSLYSTELVENILPDVGKKYKTISKSNTILSGVNEYAVLALYAAIHNSNKINKTALFFNEYQPDKLLCEVLESSAKKIEGKLFMYVNTKEENNFITDSLAENLALNSSLLLYKYDDADAGASKNIFLEAYNWLMADGTNYILKIDN